MISNATDKCRDETETITSVNIHYHGTNTSPRCGSDEVIHTIINFGEIFQYSLKFPKSEAPDLYWYHPYVHGLSEGAVLGGGSGAIIVEGIGAFGFKGRFVRKKGFQYAHVAMPLNLLDLIRTLPDDTNTLQGNRNLLIE